MTFYNNIKRLARKTYMYLCYVLRSRNRKTVYFASFRGQYSDNPRAISERLHQLAPEIKQVWLIKPSMGQYAPAYIKTVRTNTLAALKAQAQARVWVLNYTYRMKSDIYKGSKNYYIQTWHGDRGLKNIGYLSEQSKHKGYNGQDLRKCNLFIAASDYGMKKAQEGQRYHGEMMVEGMPRNDKLVNPNLHTDEIHEIRQKLGIGSNVKILLYAPTFRDGEKDGQDCTIDILQTIESLQRNGEQWICLIRAHSSSKGIKVDKETPCMDVSFYPDMADLLLITDLLITDYSSCAGDFILTGRPLVLALFDLNEYQNDARTLRVDPKEAGYIVAQSQEDLNGILSHIHTYNHREVDAQIRSFYGTHETGEASEAVARRIIRVFQDGK